MAELNENIKKHLLQNKDFLAALSDDFEESQVGQIIGYLKGEEVNDAEAIDDFYNWFHDVMRDADLDVLTIGWDSAGWGPGGNGFIRYVSKFGLVCKISSDYDDDGKLLIFDRDSFYPWGIEADFNNDFVELESSVYDINELIEISKRLPMGENAKLTINGIDVE